MLGTAVSGRSIIVLCCHHPACNGQSPRHKLMNVQKNGGAERNTPYFSPQNLSLVFAKRGEVRLKMNEWD